MISLKVSELLDKKIASDQENHLALEVVSGKSGLSKKIMIPRIQKPGLALTGRTSNLQPGRIQVLGNSEMSFLKSLPPKELVTIVKKICQVDLACIVVTHHSEIPPILKKETASQKIPLLRTPLTTAVFILRVTKVLEEKLTASTSLHGVLMDVFGVGILLKGKSGIGKSECALELIMKGHRLVADDVVHVCKKPPDSIYGMGSELIKYHMEIRGLGIINIKDLFGVAAVRDQKIVELMIELVEWNPTEEYERLGIDQTHREILGVKIPFIRLPGRPGRSLASIIEVAARNQLLKLKGFHSARDFQEKLTRQILTGGTKKERFKNFIE